MNQPLHSVETQGEKITKKEIKSKVRSSSNLNDKIQEIGIDLNDPMKIYQKVEDFKIAHSESEVVNYAAPESEIEKQLVDIWQRVLSIKQVGLNDNFFEVGGTSLKAVQLIATIKKELEANISIVTIFECPTVNLLSKKINELKGKILSESNFDEQVDRGSRRRQKTISRKR